MTQHKWAKEIIHWANGGEIEYRLPTGRWVECGEHEPPQWLENIDYRIKPQPKPDVYLYVTNSVNGIKLHRERQYVDNSSQWNLGKIKLEVDDD